MVDADFLRRALDRHEAPLLLFARRITGDPASAQDAVQDTFLRLAAQEQAAVAERLTEWLYTVCRNRALDLMRKEKAMKAREQTAEAPRVAAPAPDAEAEGREQQSRALTLMARLPARQQEALRLKFQADLSYAEIGRVMGEPIGTVGWLIHEGLKALRERMLAGEVRA